MSAQVLANLTKSIDTDIKLLETSMAPAISGTVPAGFFTSKAAEVLPIIAKCVSAKNILPPAPGGLIRRSQFKAIEDKLKEFNTDNFPFLETQLVTFQTAPEPATKATALAQIVQKLPGILADYIIMKNDLRKIKKALRV